MRPEMCLPHPGHVRLRRRHSRAFFSSPATIIKKPAPVVEARRSAVCGVIAFIVVVAERAGVPGSTFPDAADP